MPVAAAPFALELSGVRKRFGHVAALDGASLAVRAGTVHAVLGENGAGKTTLMRVAYGMVAADEGVMRVAGTPVAPASPAQAIASGIGMVHQHFALVDAMRVTENVALGGRGLFREAGVAARVAEVGRVSGLVVPTSAHIEELGIAAKQRVEIVKALARDVRVLILDEPTAVLPPNEAAELLRWVREFAAGGRSAILITHKLRDALAIADDVTVMRAGRAVLTAAAAATSAEALASAMLGDDRSPAAPPRVNTPHDTIVAEARDVDVIDARGVVRVRGATFVVRSGEIVAVAGVEGAGPRALMRALAGRVRPVAGRLSLPVSIGYIPEDRQHEGLVLEMTLVENIELRGAARRRGWPRPADAKNRARQLLAEFDIRAPGPDVIAATLSGGNQQKLVLARELDPMPSLLVAEHATRGLDVRAASALRDRLSSAAGDGAAIVTWSSDLDELVAVAHRALVLHAGHVREVPVDVRAIGLAMLGA